MDQLEQLERMQQQNEAQQRDWFEKGLIERLPEELRDSFSEEQLAALKVAFGARKWGKHPVDLRGTLNIWRWRYYYVFLLGRNRRELSRAEKRAAALAHASILALFLSFSTALGLLVLYLIKSAMGIDLFPGFSLGIWGWFKGNFL
ncbi:3-phosphoshikimate 1-carboxyvinyltransferase [Marinobacterium jannaschii]|uniref:3-phosphoshikimate 1-carboxyvinyltransferase n=1 Tax=Marinobacterium jannaschii TaxID=64970 RepID=UPI000AAF0DB5|nr:3-phosphoshikimate 1-carboxyvinyltransferase [Marinobacterium jannaschii]